MKLLLIAEIETFSKIVWPLRGKLECQIEGNGEFEVLQIEKNEKRYK